MSFIIQTMAEDPSSPDSYVELMTGRHSILNIDLTIAWDTKQFYITHPGNFNYYQLYSSKYTLFGPEVSLNGRLDRVIRKQCVQGRAMFNNVMILEQVVQNIRFNFSQTLPYYPWERVPAVYKDDIIYNYTTMTFNTFSSRSISPAVFITAPIAITCELHLSWEVWLLC